MKPETMCKRLLKNSPTSGGVTGGGVDSDDNLNIVAEPGQDLSFPPATGAAAAGAPTAAEAAFGAGAPSAAALPYILPSEGYVQLCQKS